MKHRSNPIIPLIAFLSLAACVKSSSSGTGTYKVTLKLNQLSALNKKYDAFLYNGNTPVAASKSTTTPSPTTDSSGNASVVLKQFSVNSAGSVTTDSDASLSVGTYSLYVYVDYSGDGSTQGASDKGKIVSIILDSDTTVNIAEADTVSQVVAQATFTGEANLNGGKAGCAWLVSGSNSGVTNRGTVVASTLSAGTVSGGTFTTTFTSGILPGTYNLTCFGDMNSNFSYSSPVLDSNVDYVAIKTNVSISAAGTTTITGFSLAP